MDAPHGPAVLVVDSDPDECRHAETALRGAGFAPKCVTDPDRALDTFYGAPPQCLVAEFGLPGTGPHSFIEEVKADNVYGHVPIILIITPADFEAGIDWTRVPADDYLLRPFDADELVSRVRICLARMLRDVNANPLTGLPGNHTIMREAERRLLSGEPFAFAYLDIDNFKAFNDCYGFPRGDEILRMTARIIVHALQSLNSDQTYLGHVGGDDFVFIGPSELMPRACEVIIRDFDWIVPSFYDEADRTRAAIRAVDRKGETQSYPLMTISIGVVDTQATKVSHLGDLFSRIIEVKTFTKRLPGSNFIIDRRR